MKSLLFASALALISIFHLQAQETRQLQATRLQSSITIDARLDEADWKSASVASNFTQLDPTSGADPSQKTEVKILYDDVAIYAAFICYDTSPDSILTQLGLRDQDGLNADWVRISFDTYNAQQDAYIFGVSSAGVQFDLRESDFTYNAVWDSKVRINDEGWVAEFKIPFSALRFPKDEKQVWGLQLERQIRRHRELVQWAPVTKGVQNYLTFWGKLTGINEVESPIRLQLTPYVSLVGQHYPYNEEKVDNLNMQFNGGMDLKFGISESFTLDMTLLPDFSQVQSDDLIKNLTAFEQVFEEQRAFFQEGVDLFERGNLFYSRRIGGRPDKYYEVQDQLEDGEEIVSNPGKSLLVNASKVSGRTKSGLGIGVLNAVHRNTYAEIEGDDGANRKFLTSPASNYSIVVLDQLLKNNSSFYLVNTNVSRFDEDFRSANVTGAGLTLVNKKGSHELQAIGSYSNVNQKDFDDNYDGYSFAAQISKIRDAFQYNLGVEGYSPDYDPNDFGLQFFQDIVESYANVEYNLFDPKHGFNFGQARLGFRTSNQLSTGRSLEQFIDWNVFGTISKNFLTVWTGGEWLVRDAVDLFEARKDGQIFRQLSWAGAWCGFSSDYRKRFALDGNYFFASQTEADGIAYNIMFRPIVRVNDRLSFSHEFFHRSAIKDLGYASTDDDDLPVFGKRNVHIYNNTFTAKYLFSSNMSLDLRGRHYWSRAIYDSYYDVQEDGYLSYRPGWEENNDFSYNVFNIDLVYSWQFAPGSWLNVVYKNFIENESEETDPQFFNNFGQTVKEPQTNSVSIKLLYFFDYAVFRNSLARRP